MNAVVALSEAVCFFGLMASAAKSAVGASP
jgi:hypothetical protein